MKSLEVTISKEGTIQVHAQGFQGKTCLVELQKLLEKLAKLGLDTSTISQQLTSEAYQTTSQSVQQQVR